MTLDNPFGNTSSPLRFLAENLAQRLTKEKVSPERLCVITLDVLADLYQQLAEVRQDTGKPTASYVDAPVKGALYGKIRTIARETFSQEFANEVDLAFMQVRANYDSGKMRH